MKHLNILAILFMIASNSFAQQTKELKPRPLTIEEYKKAKTFTVSDLDKDTYVKFENTYILDRYEMRKPYFITGDDGLKKRIDLYALVAKEDKSPLGTVIFYTNEKGKKYTVVQPNFTADKNVWEQYFEDIHAIDKEEKNFILKLSYVLSKEMSFQLYKALDQNRNTKAESATYGNDICFPGDQLVSMADGTVKTIDAIVTGDRIISTDPVSKKQGIAVIEKLVKHEAKNYAVTKLLLTSTVEKQTLKSNEVVIYSKAIAATPNHPILVNGIRKKMIDVRMGDNILCLNDKTKSMEKFTVVALQESADGLKHVYNLEFSTHNNFIMNGVMVLAK